MMTRRPNAVMLAMHRAAGGAVAPPWHVRNSARQMERSGGLHSAVPGRTDRLPMNARRGAYVLPADVVSGLGQGNTQAGISTLDNMFKRGPYGATLSGRMPRSPHARIPRAPAPPRFADGGRVPIVAAGGEYVIEPDEIVARFGDLGAGHQVLDQFVKNVRRSTISDMQKLPGPAR